MDDMGKFTASDDFSLGTNEDDGVSDLFGAAEAGPLDAFKQWAWATPGFIPWARAQEERFGSWLEDEMPSRSDTRQYEIRLTSRWPAARPYLNAVLATRTVGARRGDPVIGSDGMGFDLFKDVLPKIPIVGGIEAAFEPHSTQGVAAALGAIHEDEGYGVAAPAPPRFGRRVAAMRAIDEGRLHGRPWWAHERHER
jgi:hypothetical protein